MPRLSSFSSKRLHRVGGKIPVANIPPGQQAYITPGTYSWTAPAGVTSVCVVCVGGGGGGMRFTSGYKMGCGGGGGGLGWKNNIPVVPGQSYTVVVGAAGTYGTNYPSGNGGTSYFIDTSTVAGFGGQGASNSNVGGGAYAGDGGGIGGSSGGDATNNTGGAGGAGGYAGKGGRGSGSGYTVTEASGLPSGGAGGGGGANNSGGMNGGGVGIYGQGTTGSNGVGWRSGTGTDGTPGSGGSNTTYGGGGGMYSTPGAGTGAVRIIWGTGRAFPSTNTADL